MDVSYLEESYPQRSDVQALKILTLKKSKYPFLLFRVQQEVSQVVSLDPLRQDHHGNNLLLQQERDLLRDLLQDPGLVNHQKDQNLENHQKDQNQENH